MRYFNWLCILFFCIVTTTAMQAKSSALQGGAMLSCSAMPCVDVTLKNGKHLHMLVDLGDFNSIVDSAVAKDLGLSMEPVSVTGHDGKPISGFSSSTLVGAQIGNASLGDLPVRVRDLSASIQKGQMPQADGVLSYTAFHDRLLQLDYKRHTVRVSVPLTADMPCPGFCGDVTMPTFGKTGPPVLVTTGFSVNGKPITAQIDTLFTGTMLIYPDSVGKLGLQAASGVNATQFFKYTDGGVPMREGNAHTEAFGSKALAHNTAIFFATPQVHVPDGMFDGTVGAGLLIGHVVNIDLHSKHFWIAN